MKMTDSRARSVDPHHARHGESPPTESSASSESGVARTYDRLAPLYDTVFGQVLEPGRRRMAQCVRTLQPASLLEVGVGTGLALAGYPPECRIVGIDLSHDMLERARERAARLPQHHIAIEHMNAERMRFPDASFDCVTLPYVLSVTPRPAELVREARRVCKPGGTLVVLNHFSGSKAWWLLERAVRSAAEHVGFRSDFRYDEQILAHDWQVLSVESVNLFGLSKLVVLRNRGE
jgi:phosphatidylethanolamine/phosphatidyl-N-methylethanolamine N-methyltransferase